MRRFSDAKANSIKAYFPALMLNFYPFTAPAITPSMM